MSCVRKQSFFDQAVALRCDTGGSRPLPAREPKCDLDSVRYLDELVQFAGRFQFSSWGITSARTPFPPRAAAWFFAAQRRLGTSLADLASPPKAVPLKWFRLPSGALSLLVLSVRSGPWRRRPGLISKLASRDRVLGKLKARQKAGVAAHDVLSGIDFAEKRGGWFAVG